MIIIDITKGNERWTTLTGGLRIETRRHRSYYRVRVLDISGKVLSQYARNDPSFAADIHRRAIRAHDIKR